MNAEPLVFERAYHAPVVEAWKATTDNEDMKQWYFNLEEFKPEIDTFPSNNPDFSRESFAERWTSILDMALNDFLEHLAPETK